MPAPARVLRWAIAVFLAIESQAAPLGTAFTYQGRLIDGCCPANGRYDLQFEVFDAPQPGQGNALPAGGPVILTRTVPVTNGIFTVTLDFGANVFTGQKRFLQIDVRTNTPASNGPWATLDPRTELTPAPHALYAETVGSLPAGAVNTFQIVDRSITAAKIATGQVVKSLNQLHDDVSLVGGANISVTPRGNNLEISTTAPAGWNLTGNSGTTPGANYLGTADDKALEVKVNGQRALRIEPNGAGAASLIGGYHQNAASGVGGAIAGGGTSGSPNYVNGIYGFVGAGHGNQVGAFSSIASGAYNRVPAQFSGILGGYSNTNAADYAFVGGGSTNRILANANRAVIAGGHDNEVANNAVDATISGGGRNRVKGPGGTIAGGGNNLVDNFNSTVGGGAGNTADGSAAVVAGGSENHSSGAQSAVGGGQDNLASGNHAVVAGGQSNRSTGLFSTVPGGWRNVASGYGSVAMGIGAEAKHVGSIVIADASGQSLASTTDNQFLVRATGGARFEGAGLTSIGTINGIEGKSSNPNASGVYGENGGGGYGIAGRAFGDGIGIYGENTDPTGWGGYFVGRVFMDRSLQVGDATLSNDQGGSLELGHYQATDRSTPYIDFHYGFDGGKDYDVRIINEAANTLRIRAFGIAQPLAELSPAGLFINGPVVPLSDRNLKENFRSVDPAEVLDKLVAIPLTEWNYKNDPATRHLGPMAQDFFGAFSVGPDDKHITTVDADGVAFAAIQGLNAKVESLKVECARRDTEIDGLRKELVNLKRLVEAVAAQRNGGGQ